MKTTKPCETNIDINGDKSMTKVLKSLLKSGYTVTVCLHPREKGTPVYCMTEKYRLIIQKEGGSMHEG